MIFLCLQTIYIVPVIKTLIIFPLHFLFATDKPQPLLRPVPETSQQK